MGVSVFFKHKNCLPGPRLSTEWVWVALSCVLPSTGPPPGPERLHQKVQKPLEHIHIFFILILGATISSQTERAQGCICSTEKELVRTASGRAHLGHYCDTVCGQTQCAVGREDELTPPSIGSFGRHLRFSSGTHCFMGRGGGGTDMHLTGCVKLSHNW